MEDVVTLEVEDGVARVGLNRPSKRNAYNRAMLARLDEVLASLADREDVGVVVLFGQAGTFCSGGDLIEVRGLAHGGQDELQDGWFAPLYGVTRRLTSLPVPTVAAVRGLALAGGLELAMCCDFIVTSDEARLGDQHINAGLIPGGGATQLLAERVGRQRAMELILTGRRVRGQEAVSIGLALWSAAEEEFDKRLDAFLSMLTAKRPAAMEAVKLLMSRTFDLEDVRAEMAVAVRDMTSPPTLELLDSFGNG